METLDQAPEYLKPLLFEKPVISEVPEVTPNPESESELLGKRIEVAIGDCEFEPTAEVQEAIHGFYSDHYVLGSMIEAGVTGEIGDEDVEELLSLPDGVVSSEQFDIILDNFRENSPPPSAESATRLLAASIKRERSAKTTEERDKQRATTLRLAWASLTKVLFQETSLGITTIGDPEIESAVHLYGILVEAISVNDSITDINTEEMRPDGDYGLKHRISNAQELLWDDVRYAGQLEFTNSPYLKEIVEAGGVMPRTEQFRLFGKMKSNTGVAGGSRSLEGRMHSVVPHFSENFQPGFYRGNEMKGGTVVLPLAEIIKIAPFARDAEYATLTPLTSELSRVPMKTAEGLMMGTEGGRDNIPASSGVDRVFFATSSEKGESKPDGYVLPVDKDSGATIILVGDEAENSEQYSSEGQGALQLHIERIGKLSDRFPGDPHPTPDNNDAILEQILSLQRQYLNDPRYKSRLIVPLRRGVFDFRSEAMSGDQYRPKSEYDVIPLPPTEQIASSTL